MGWNISAPGGSITLVDLDFSFCGTALQVDGAANVTVVGSTITNSANSGAAIIGTNLGEISIKASTLHSNHQSGPGGALNILAGTVYLVSSVFLNNFSNQHGGVGAITGSLFVSDCYFEMNSAAIGGGVLFVNGTQFSVQIESSTFLNNSASMAGTFWLTVGTIEILNSTANVSTATSDNGAAGILTFQSLRIAGSSFFGSFAAASAGIFELFSAKGKIVLFHQILQFNYPSGAVTKLDISNCSFTDNGANSKSAGALYIAADNVTISNSTFTNNFAGTSGGAIYFTDTGRDDQG